MASSELADALVAGAPYPRIVPSGEIIDGSVLPQPFICKLCPERRCARLHDTPQDFFASNCYRGVGTVLFMVEGTPHVFNGLRLDSPAPTVERKLKRQLDSPELSVHQIRQWVLSASDAAVAFGAAVERAVNTSLGTFHDVQTSVTSIIRSGERLVSQATGTTYDEKFGNLSETQQTLIKAAELLNARLKLMPLLANPAAAAYGQLRSRRVYPLVDSLIRVLRPVAASRNVRLNLRGHSLNSRTAFDSFDTVPLVLLENAIKYSLPNETVDIEINDVPSGVRVAITSFSPYIPPSERDTIFQRGVRGVVAGQVADTGSGIGLYTARIVADAHGFKIVHTSDDRDIVVNRVRYCSNTFSFTLT
jgi:signal transduction histidine kinase